MKIQKNVWLAVVFFIAAGFTGDLLATLLCFICGFVCLLGGFKWKRK